MGCFQKCFASLYAIRTNRERRKEVKKVRFVKKIGEARRVAMAMTRWGVGW